MAGTSTSPFWMTCRIQKMRGIGSQRSGKAKLDLGCIPKIDIGAGLGLRIQWVRGKGISSEGPKT